jgi:hypothetical protein
LGDHRKKEEMIMKNNFLTLTLLGFALCVPVSTQTNASPLGVTGAGLRVDDSVIELVQRRGGRVGGGRVGRVGGAAVRRGAVVGRGGAAVRRGAVVGRGGAAVRRGAVVGRGGVVRRGVVVRRGAWVRPGRFWWPVGGAIAAGAAIGFVGAATAAAWAGPAPGPGMCWYYTDPTQRQGFWDACQ